MSKQLLIFKQSHGGAEMPRITVYIPDDLKKRMDKRPEVNWAEVIREGFKRKIEKLKRFEQMEGW